MWNAPVAWQLFLKNHEGHKQKPNRGRQSAVVVEESGTQVCLASEVRIKIVATCHPQMI